LIPSFAFPAHIRRVIYTTNAIESVNARLRKIIKTQGHFPVGMDLNNQILRATHVNDAAKNRYIAFERNKWHQGSLLHAVTKQSPNIDPGIVINLSK